MSLAVSFSDATKLPGRAASAAVTTPLVEELADWFGVEFSFWDGLSGQLLQAPRTQPGGDEYVLGELVRAAARQVGPCFLDEQADVLWLALPLPECAGLQVLAVAPFVIRHAETASQAAPAARLLGLPPQAARDWINGQTLWSADALQRLARAVQAKLQTQQRMTRFQDQLEKVSENLSSTYEELSLLYGVTQNLRISHHDEDLGHLALDWMLECLPAQGVVIQFLPVDQQGNVTYKARLQPQMLTRGQCPLDPDAFTRLTELVAPAPHRGPAVVNSSVTGGQTWPFPQVRQLLLVPLAEGQNLFGWLAAINHAQGDEFGTVEANLLSSVGAILGIHSGNRELYRQQAEFLASVIRALVSAIDAKDPYTCGHSDRVARISVRLAKEIGCEQDMLHTIYMAGLVHDIGKIGIDDNVLRKPGRLTDAEFEHIKLHPQLGYKILADLKQLADVLPAVLHHHEQWDGGGYPHGLSGEQIPQIARIMAVADAFDAMTSDRPYRHGMDQEQVEQIFRRGAGQQWDPEAIAAYFQARDDIRQICCHERANLTLDVCQWT